VIPVAKVVALPEAFPDQPALTAHDKTRLGPPVSPRVTLRCSMARLFAAAFVCEDTLLYKLFYMGRVVAWTCFVDIFLHVFYTNALLSSDEFLHVTPFEMHRCFYLGVGFTYLKFYSIFRFFRGWALLVRFRVCLLGRGRTGRKATCARTTHTTFHVAPFLAACSLTFTSEPCHAMQDGVETYENMGRCFSRGYSFTMFWKSWHASLNRWVLRYLYVPLKGYKYQLVSVWFVFLFVAFWHEPTLLWVRWALLNGLGMVIDRLLEMVAARSLQKGHEDGLCPLTVAPHGMFIAMRGRAPLRLCCTATTKTKPVVAGSDWTGGSRGHSLADRGASDHSGPRHDVLPSILSFVHRIGDGSSILSKQAFSSQDYGGRNWLTSP